MAEIINVTVDDSANVNEITIGDSIVTNNLTVSDAGSVNVSITDGVVVASNGVVASDLSSLSDVNISSLQDGQYLVYDSTTSKWINTSNEYKHHQNNSAMIWDITHNLNLANYLPNVTIKLNGGLIINSVQAMGLVEYVDQNRLKINFLTSKSGYAYIKK